MDEAPPKGLVVRASGNLFDSQAQTLVNAVNCVGIMGKGIAWQFKHRYPRMFLDYAARCKRGEVHLGEPYAFPVGGGKLVLNFPTKGHWREASRLQDIVTGLEFLEGNYQQMGITSLAVPPLGCGNGGLAWREVGPVLRESLSRLSIPVELYEPLEGET